MLKQALPLLGADTPVDQFCWDYKTPSGKTGREVVMDWFQSVQRRAPVHADKSLGVLRGVFNYAMHRGWIDSKQINPALSSRFTKNTQESTSHPTLAWDQVPQFLKDLEQNDANGNLITICAVKVKVGSTSCRI